MEVAKGNEEAVRGKKRGVKEWRDALKCDGVALKGYDKKVFNDSESTLTGEGEVLMGDG